MASTTSIPGGKQPCSGSLWPPGRAPRPTADGIVCVLQNRPASADSRVRFTAVAVDAGARVAAGDERGALVVVDAARNRFERVATLDARATALAWVGDRVACAVCHPRAPRLVAVDAATGTLSEVAAAHAPGTSIATLDARDRLVVTAARDAARFWTLDGDWLRQSAFEGAGAEVAAAAVGTDGNAVVLDRDGVVHLVNPSSGQATAQLSPQHGEAPSRGVWSCVAALSGGAVVAGGPLLCEWAPGGAFERLSAPPPRARSVVALLRAGSDLLALGENGRLNALDVSQPSAAAATLAVAPRAVVVAAAAAGASVAVATADGELLLLDLAVARRRQPVGPTPLRRYFPAPEPAAPEPAAEEEGYWRPYKKRKKRHVPTPNVRLRVVSNATGTVSEDMPRFVNVKCGASVARAMLPDKLWPGRFAPRPRSYAYVAVPPAVQPARRGPSLPMDVLGFTGLG